MRFGEKLQAIFETMTRIPNTFVEMFDHPGKISIVFDPNVMLLGRCDPTGGLNLGGSHQGLCHSVFPGLERGNVSADPF